MRENLTTYLYTSSLAWWCPRAGTGIRNIQVIWHMLMSSYVLSYTINTPRASVIIIIRVFKFYASTRYLPFGFIIDTSASGSAFYKPPPLLVLHHLLSRNCLPHVLGE